MDLDGKVAIVTGAGRGIGRATALALSRLGVKVVLAAKTASEIESVAAEVAEKGGEGLALPADVSEKSQVQGLVAEARRRFGQIDILVCNAGVAIHNPIPEIREEDWDLNIAVNLKGVFLCTQAVFPLMCEQKRGHIVNVSSTAGKRGALGFGAYCASKYGVVGFTEVTAAEGRPYGVKASVVCPGPVDTQMRRENHPDDVVAHLALPGDIADAVVFLLAQPDRAHTLELVVSAPLM